MKFPTKKFLGEDLTCDQRTLDICNPASDERATAGLRDVQRALEFYVAEITRFHDFGIADHAGTHNHRMVYESAGDGLTAYIFTNDLAKAEQYAAALRYGEIQINGLKYDIDLLHGGIGQSDTGHDCSYLALHNYLVLKRITRSIERSAA